MSKEIEFQNLEIQLAEKRIKEGKYAIETKTAVVDESKKLYKERKKDLDLKKKELDDIVAETEKEEKDLTKKSEAAAKAIEERLLKAYHRIRGNARNGLAVVHMERGSCGGCFNSIPPQRQLDIASHEDHRSEHCGHLIDESIVDEVEVIAFMIVMPPRCSVMSSRNCSENGEYRLSASFPGHEGCSRAIGHRQHAAGIRQALACRSDQGWIILEVVDVTCSVYPREIDAHMVGAEAEPGGIAHVRSALARIAVCIGIGPNTPSTSEIPRPGTPFGTNPYTMSGAEVIMDGIVLHAEIIAADTVSTFVQFCLTEIGVAIIDAHQAMLSSDVHCGRQNLPWSTHTIIEVAIR